MAEPHPKIAINHIIDEDFPGACTISTGGEHLCALQQASGLVVCCWDEMS